MWMIILFWGLLALPVLVMSVWLYRRVARTSRVLAVLLALVLLSTIVLIWPIPIHGGFTIVAEILYDEWRSNIRDKQNMREEKMDRAFIEKSLNRFSGPLDYKVQRSLERGWLEVETEKGERGWLSSASKLIWSESLALNNGNTMPPLSLGKQRCKQLAPSGKWALATEAEHAMRWQTKGDEVMGESPYSMLSYFVDETMRMEMPTYALKNKVTMGQTGTRAPYAVRCVARTVDAPHGGYTKKDLSLELWNAYQLSKM